MKRVRLLWMVWVWVAPAGALAQQENNPFEKAQRAWASREYATYVQNMQLVVENVGKQPELLLNMARAYALLGDTTASIGLLRQLAAMQLPYRLRKDTAFASLQQSPTFQQLAATMLRYAQPTLRSQAGFVLRDRSMIPEGLAYDPGSKSFFVGSMAKRKIVRVNQKGLPKDFTTSGQDGLWSVLGMKVESQKRMVWVCSADFQTGRSGLFAYDLKTGTLHKKYLLPDSSGRHLLNDLTILENGNLFVTDSEEGTLYTFSPGQDKLVVYNPALRLIYPNGITHDEEGQRLYVAHFGGISVISLATKEAQPLAAPETIPLFGVDGLYFYENTLIGVQNGIEADRIIRFSLGENGQRVTGADVLESNHPHFRIPTTGAIAGKSFYYIANSQLRQLNPDGSVQNPEKLKDIVVLQIKL